MVPVLAHVLMLVSEYLSLCPYDLPEDGPLFVGAKGGVAALGDGAGLRSAGTAATRSGRDRSPVDR